MAWVEIMLANARTLPTGKLTQNPIRTGERRCILYVGDDSGITLACDRATHSWTIGPLVRSRTCENGRNAPSASATKRSASMIASSERTMRASTCVVAVDSWILVDRSSARTRLKQFDGVSRRIVQHDLRSARS